jgi:hypothetical protein
MKTMNKYLKPLAIIGILVVMALLSISCAPYPWHDTNWFHFDPFFFGFPSIFGLALYCLPIIIAAIRHSKNLVGIILVNILAGWTFVGWIIALIWAIKGETTKVKV